jgi:hypothetical protein
MSGRGWLASMATVASASAAVGSSAAVGCWVWAARADAFVYWANLGANTLGRASLDGSSPVPGFITGASTPRGADPREGVARWRRRRGWGLIGTLTVIVGMLAAAAVPASAVRPPAAPAPELAWKPCADPARVDFSAPPFGCRWTTPTRAGARSGSR